MGWSWNKEKHSVGSVVRYPLQGLPEGNQEEWKGAESMKLTTEGAKGKAIALVPETLEPDKPVTTKGLEVPMGGGKGAVDHYVAIVRAGTVVFEMDGVAEDVAREAFRLAEHKMPFKGKFITRAV